VSFSPQSEETLSPRTAFNATGNNTNGITGTEKPLRVPQSNNPNANTNNDDEMIILHQLRPIIRRFVVIMKDYSHFVDLCREYSGCLDLRFVNAVSTRIISIEKEISVLIEGRWPEITSYMKHTFHRSLVELEVKAKEGAKGSIADMSQLFQDTLRQCYTLVKMIRDSVFSKEDINFKTGNSSKIRKSSSGIITFGKDKAVARHRRSNDPHLPSKSNLSSESEVVKLTSTAGKPCSKARRKTDSIQRSRTLSSRHKNVKAIPQQENIRPSTQPSIPVVCSEWRCFKCTVTNLKGDKCNMCGEPKPVIFRIPSSTTLKDIDFEEVRVNAKWICSCCKFVNSNSTLKRCQMCNQENFKDDDNVNGWTCTRCSLKNHSSLIKCNMCAKGRFSSNSRFRSVSSPPGQSPGKADNSKAAKNNQQPLRTISNNSSYINKSLSSRRKIVPLSEANIRIH
jgi:hypothetical protein